MIVPQRICAEGKKNTGFGVAGLFCYIIFVVIVLWPGHLLAAGTLKAAVAANFIEPFKEIAVLFEKESGIKVEGTFTSSGNLQGQIINGAPYDIFLSADEERPADLYGKGLATAPFVYATGRVVLWGEQKICGAENWLAVMARKDVVTIAIANPALAPYGAAAETALRKAGLWEHPEKKWITAQTVGQAFQFAHTGGTDICFGALSSALSDEGRGGCYYLIEEAPPIKQSACLILRTVAKDDAVRFLDFLQSPAAEIVKKRFGYQ